MVSSLKKFGFLNRCPWLFGWLPCLIQDSTLVWGRGFCTAVPVGGIVISLPDGYVPTRHTAFVSNMWPKGSSDKNCVSPSTGKRSVKSGRIPDYNLRILVVSLATKSLTSSESHHMKKSGGVLTTLIHTETLSKEF